MKPFYEILVGNIGAVHKGTNAQIARKTYNMYVKASKKGSGRASGEDVTLWKDGEIISEHYGTSLESNPSISKISSNAYIVYDSRQYPESDYPRFFKSISTATKFAKSLNYENDVSIYKENLATGIMKEIKKVKGRRRLSKNPSSTKEDWIPCHAIRQLPSGDIQLLTERGTMSNPGKRKGFLKKIEKTFGKIVGKGKRKR